MKPKTDAMALEEAATDLIDAGCLALLYTERLAENGTLHLNVYPRDFRVTTSGKEVYTSSQSTTNRANHVLENVNAVTVGDQTVPFWTDIDVYGINSPGRKPLYVHESITSNAEFGVSEQSLDDGLAAVTAILQEDE